MYEAHGMSGTHEYQIWCSMIQRCHNPKSPRYPEYGARGIQVCDRWRGSFRHFISDLGLRPSSRHTLERIDTNGNYCPENCCWATWSAQANNKRNNIVLEYRGERKTLAEWALFLGVDYHALHRRHERGWTAERLLSTPVRPKPRVQDSP